MNRVYVCIDLKSFYASVECVVRHLDPLDTNLVVADLNRTQKTICLAVTPPLKSYGISSRSRLYEVISKVNEINKERKLKLKNHKFSDKSYLDSKLKKDDSLELSYIIAPPRMSLYMKYSTKVYNIYLKYISREDIFAYSIDEVFIDLTTYINYYKMTSKEIVTKILNDIHEKTGLTATAGIGTNMYLAKIAMDIVAKHSSPDKNGARIAFLDQDKYKQLLWTHKPITDFWSIGPGTKRRLETYKMYTMGDIALCSIKNEKLLYKLFGVNAEVLIDHSWGIDPCTISSVKLYKPNSKSLSSSQVLHTPYTFNSASLILREMIEVLTLEMVSKHYMTDIVTLTCVYDVENLKNPNIKKHYHGEVVLDHYGRYIPKPSHGSIRFEKHTSSTKQITTSLIKLYNEIVNEKLLIRKLCINFCNLINESIASKEVVYKQFDLFLDAKNYDIEKHNEIKNLKSERILQQTIIDLKEKFGKNAVLKANSLEEGSTMIQRNLEIGGHMG